MNELNGVTVPIENTEFVRDMGSKAVINTDAAGLQRYKAARNRILAERKDNRETKERLETIEQDMATLKSIVSELSVLRSRT
jgi:transposase-like protein